MATDIEIFIGTSQDFLLSFRVKKTDEDTFNLERVIAHRCHNGSIICMDTSGRYLATGGGDDRVAVIDLKLNRDVHEIICHDGSINSLVFTNKGSDLLSGSDDGRLVATTVGSWQPVNIWKKPHTGKAVLKVCLHQSDKFAITLGKDGTLRGWDMLKGTQINTFNTRDMSDARVFLDNIELCPGGNTFAASGTKTVVLVSIAGDESYAELTLKSRVTSMCWLDDENLLIGMENGSIEWRNIKTSEHVTHPNIHAKRIKGMHHLNGFLGTICSTGNVSLWATSIANKKLTLICTTIDESVRPTCIKLIDTTDNRYKQQQAKNIDAGIVKASVPRSTKRSRPISTAGKVIVEVEGSENKKTRLTSITDDDSKDTEIVKKKPKKKLSSNVVSSSTPADNSNAITPTTSKTKKRKTPKLDFQLATKSPAVLNSDDDFESETKRPKNKKKTPEKTKKLPVKTKKTTPQKQIVVRSVNSDDDFENTEVRRFNKKKQKKTIENTEEPAIGMVTPQKSFSTTTPQKQRNSSDFNVTDSQENGNLSTTSLHDVTPVMKKKKKTPATPMSCPAGTQQMAISQNSAKKNSKARPSPTHLMATRNKRKPSL